MDKAWIWLLIASRFAASYGEEPKLPDCPTPCLCKWKSGKPTINCRDKNLSYVPHYRPLSVENPYQVLVMDNNNIMLSADPQFSAVGYDNIQTLTMKNCRLESIQPLTFSGLHNLRELVLSNNLLTMLIPYQFTDLPKLRSLDLSFNKISSVYEESFSALGPHLERIDLSNNMLYTMSVSVLRPLSSLNQLLLFKNPWNCYCELGELNSFLHEKNVKTEYVECSKPSMLQNQNWRELHLSEFTCPPRIQMDVIDGSDRESNPMVTLRCEVTGNPLPQILWEFHGNILASFNNELYQQHVADLITKESYYKLRVSNLTFSRTNESSLTPTKCLASNSLGDVEKSYPDLSTVGVLSQVDDRSNSVLIISLLAVGGSLIFSVIIVLCYCWRIKKKQVFVSDKSFSIKNRMIALISKPDKYPFADFQEGSEVDSSVVSRSSTNETYRTEVSHNDGDATYMSGKDPCDSMEDLEEWATPINTAGCRSSILSNSSSFAHLYGSLRRPYYPQYTSSSNCQVVHCNRGPGYVTLPRRPQLNVAPVTSVQSRDWMESRTSADGCSHSNIFLAPNVTSNEPVLCQSISLPPYLRPTPTKTAINIVGLPTNTPTVTRVESASSAVLKQRSLSEIEESICASTHLVSIPEQI